MRASGLDDGQPDLKDGVAGIGRQVRLDVGRVGVFIARSGKPFGDRAPRNLRNRAGHAAPEGENRPSSWRESHRIPTPRTRRRRLRRRSNSARPPRRARSRPTGTPAAPESDFAGAQARRFVPQIPTSSEPCGSFPRSVRSAARPAPRCEIPRGARCRHRNDPLRYAVHAAKGAHKGGEGIRSPIEAPRPRRAYPPAASVMRRLRTYSPSETPVAQA